MNLSLWGDVNATWDDSIPPIISYKENENDFSRFSASVLYPEDSWSFLAYYPLALFVPNSTLNLVEPSFPFFRFFLIKKAIPWERQAANTENTSNVVGVLICEVGLIEINTRELGKFAFQLKKHFRSLGFETL